MSELAKKQAEIPAGARWLPNRIGTAPGLTLKPGTCLVCALPGVPRELYHMMQHAVEPLVHQAFPGLRPGLRRQYRTLGLGESSVAERIRPVLERAGRSSPGLAGMAVHFRAEMPQVILTLEVGHDHAGRRVSAEELASLDHDLTQALRPGLYGIGSTDLPGRVVHALKRAGLWLATAESCTGGQVASMVTSVPSASACFRGGLVAYSNQLKTRLLEVPPTLIETHGAVSEPVARAMAEGARAAFQADFALATTGIAGPAGGTPEKPVGTVHAAVSAAGGTSHRKLNLRGDRGTIQRSAALWLLKLVWDQLEEQGAATIEDSSTEPTIG